MSKKPVTHLIWVDYEGYDRVECDGTRGDEYRLDDPEEDRLTADVDKVTCRECIKDSDAKYN